MYSKSGINSNSQDQSKWKWFPIKCTQLEKFKDGSSRAQGRLITTHHNLPKKEEKEKKEDFMGLMSTIADINVQLNCDRRKAQAIDRKIEQANNSNKQVFIESEKLASLIEILNGALEILEFEFVNLKLYIQGDYIHGMERHMRFQQDEIYDHQGRFEKIHLIDQIQKQIMDLINKQIDQDQLELAIMDEQYDGHMEEYNNLKQQENELLEQKQKIDKTNLDNEMIKQDKKYETMIYSEILHAQKSKPRHYLLIEPIQQEEIVVNIFNVQDTRNIKLENNEFKNIDFKNNPYRSVAGMMGKQQKQIFQFDFIFQNQLELVTHIEFFIIGSLYTNLNPIYKQNGTGDCKSYEQFYSNVPSTKNALKFENMEKIQSSLQAQIIILSDQDYGLTLNVIEYAYTKLQNFRNQFVQVDSADIQIVEILENSYEIKNIIQTSDWEAFKYHYEKLAKFTDKHYRFTINCYMRDQTVRKINIILLSIRQLRLDIFGKMYKAAIFKNEKISYTQQFQQLFKYSKCLVLTNIPQLTLENQQESYKAVRQILEIQSHLYFQQDQKEKEKNKQPQPQPLPQTQPLPSKENHGYLFNQSKSHLLRKY
ncbi:hypothetical protein pb186bvf_009225 [Paramecium bursaria]